MTNGSKRRRRDIGEPQLAYLNPRFMQSHAARSLRIGAEYLEPQVRLLRARVENTVVFFGSARLLPRALAEERLAELQARATSDGPAPAAAEMKAALIAVEMSRYYEEARQLAKLITRWSLSLGQGKHFLVVCSGGGPGIMEAANRGAYEAGGKSIGLSIELPHEQFANPYISPELSFNFHYFFMRKLWFAQIAKALIVFPGGFGTMDELWEMMTLLQTGKLAKNNLILIYGRKYWDEVLNWKAMVRWGTINEDEYKLLQFADEVDEAFDIIRAGLEKYHMDVDPFLQAY